MRICVATTKGGLDDNVAPTFGRCPTYTLVECEGTEIRDSSVVENSSANAMGGAGIQAAQYVAGQGAEAVIAGNFGPNSISVLSQSNVKSIQAQGIVGEVVTSYLKGELGPLAGSTVKGHFGMGPGPGDRK